MARSRSKQRANSDDLNRDVYIFLTLVTARFAADVDRLCGEEGLTEAHYRILWVLCLTESDEGLTMGGIVDGLVTKASDVTRLVDKLERLDMVRRKPSAEDGRRVMVTVTPTGKRVFARLTPKIKDVHVRQMAGLADDDKHQLVSLLNNALWGYSRS